MSWRPRAKGGFKCFEALEYKGYKIVIRISSISSIPSKYQIKKISDGKEWDLREMGYCGKPISTLTKLATDYIDSYPQRLEDKLKKLKISQQAIKHY